jgi:hypothetical protein
MQPRVGIQPGDLVRRGLTGPREPSGEVEPVPVGHTVDPRVLPHEVAELEPSPWSSPSPTAGCGLSRCSRPGCTAERPAPRPATAHRRRPPRSSVRRARCRRSPPGCSPRPTHRSQPSRRASHSPSAQSVGSANTTWASSTDSPPISTFAVAAPGHTKVSSANTTRTTRPGAVALRGPLGYRGPSHAQYMMSSA